MITKIYRRLELREIRPVQTELKIKNDGKTGATGTYFVQWYHTNEKAD